MTDLLLLPGDGIGPEVTAQVRRVAEALTPNLTLDERPFGGTSYDQLGTPLADETLAAAKAARAVLMGAVGGPKWVGVPRALVGVSASPLEVRPSSRQEVPYTLSLTNLDKIDPRFPSRAIRTSS